jgi:hypothetical protein
LFSVLWLMASVWCITMTILASIAVRGGGLGAIAVVGRWGVFWLRSTFDFYDV